MHLDGSLIYCSQHERVRLVDLFQPEYLLPIKIVRASKVHINREKVLRTIEEVVLRKYFLWRQD